MKLIPVLVFILLTLPLVTLAQGIVPCDGPDCGFEDLMVLASKVVDFLVLISIPLAAIAFAWAGFMYMSSGGDPGKISRAHGIFLKVGIGLILVLGSYLIVKLIFSVTSEGLESYL